MDKFKMMKWGLSALGMALSLASTLVNNKVSDSKLKDTVAEMVKEALENQVKES